MTFPLEGLRREDIADILFEVDQRLKDILQNDLTIDLIIIGSGAFLLKGLLTRVTYDIDTFTINDNKVRLILEEYNINDAGSRIMTICENYDKRVEKVNLPLEKINLFVLSDLDLVISKLGSTRPKDIQDIIESGLINKIDFDTLENIIKEELASPVNPQRLWGDYNYLKSLRNK
jgi:hypothetical protein